MACESIVLSFNTCQVWSTLQCTACLHAASRRWTRVGGRYLRSRQQDSKFGALPDLEVRSRPNEPMPRSSRQSFSCTAETAVSLPLH